MAGFVGPELVTSGLVLALDAADKNSYPGSGTSWYDLSNNVNTGTLTNSPTFSNTNGGCIVFDGVDDYINCGNNSSLKLTGDITIDTWIYISANPSDWVRICGIGSSDGGSGNRMYGLWYNGTNASVTRNLLWQRYSPGTQIYPTTVALSLNTWYYVSVTTNGSLHTLYLNNLSIGTTTSAGPWTTNTVDNVTIGYAGFHTYHTGRIGLIRIYNRALTATEVLQNYNVSKTRFGL